VQFEFIVAIWENRSCLSLLVSSRLAPLGANDYGPCADCAKVSSNFPAMTYDENRYLSI